MLFGREPAIWMAAIQAVLATLIGLGVIGLTNEQFALVMGSAAALAALFVRQASTPNASVNRVVTEKLADKVVEAESRAVSGVPPGTDLPRTGVTLALVGALALCSVGTAFAQPEASRVSVGLSGGAMWRESDGGSMFGPMAGPYLTYNAAEHLTLGMAYEYEFKNDYGLARISAATPLVNVGRSRIYGAVDGAYWTGNHRPLHQTSVQFRLQGSVPLLSDTDAQGYKRTLVWLVASGAVDPQQEEDPMTLWRVLLRWQGAGGRER